MKSLKHSFLLVFALLAFAIQSKAQVNPSSTYVSGYTKSDGTAVSGYNKTTPNSTNRDNYSTKPNVNPYTGTTGTVEPDSKPAPTYNYSTPAPAATREVQTGSRGGQYYINGNGNKTYIKQ